MQPLEEQWKDILGWPYRVSNLGQVKRNRSRKMLSQSTDTCGYRQVKLYRRGEYTLRSVHQLVLICFGSPKPTDKHETNHKDANKRNNCIDNLEWITHRENILHAHRNGLFPKRKPLTKPPHWSRLSQATIDEIKIQRASGVKARVLAERYGISMGYLYQLATGSYEVKWPHNETSTPCVQ